MNGRAIYNKVTGITMCSVHKTIATVDAVEYIVTNDIRGDFVECGVFRGGQVMAIIYTLQALGVERDIYLYDTFEGVPEPEEWEVKVKNGAPATDSFRSNLMKDGTSGWCRSGIDEVKKNVLSLGYNNNLIHFVKGKVEDTLFKSNHDMISLLRLDTDLYSSTKVELELLYPKVNDKGVLIVDDYDNWSGSRKAVDDYFNERNISFKVNDSTGLVKINKIGYEDL